jgi:hypothetical protein
VRNSRGASPGIDEPDRVDVATFQHSEFDSMMSDQEAQILARIEAVGDFFIDEVTRLRRSMKNKRNEMEATVNAALDKVGELLCDAIYLFTRS